MTMEELTNNSELFDEIDDIIEEILEERGAR